MTFDPDRLARLRQRYADASGGQTYDTHFKEVADQVFRGTDRRPWPFADPATFLDAPFIADGLRPDVLDKLDVALIGVPMDLGVTNRAGARLGPRAIGAIESVETYEHVLSVAPLGVLEAADVGDVAMKSRFDNTK